MKRTIRVETTKCKGCGVEMCEPHLSHELGVAARCRVENLGHLCARCGAKCQNDTVLEAADSLLRHASVRGVVVDDAILRQVLVCAGKRRLSIHAERGGALVVSEDKTWR